MKYIGLRNQLLALKAQLPQRGLTIVIEGGLPETAVAKAPDPPGIDLKHQHRVFARPKDASKASEPADVAPKPAKRA